MPPPDYVDVLCHAECCIFHKSRPFGEWSDGEDSDRECDDSCADGGGEASAKKAEPGGSTAG